MSPNTYLMRGAVTMAALSAAGNVLAAEFQVANLNVLYTTRSSADPVLGTGTGDEKLKTYQFEYFAGYKYGDVYVDAEVYHGDNVGGNSNTST